MADPIPLLKAVKGLKDQAERMASRGDGPLAGGPGGGDNDGMEQRVSRLEQALARIDAILPTLATKSDLQLGLQGTELRLVKWMIGVGIAGAAVIIAVMSALIAQTQSAPVASAPAAPIIITVPSPYAAPAAGPAAPPAPSAPAE